MKIRVLFNICGPSCFSFTNTFRIEEKLKVAGFLVRESGRFKALEILMKSKSKREPEGL